MTPPRTNAFETPTNVGDGHHRPTIGATSTGRFHCGVCGTATPIGEVHKCELTRRQRRAVEAQKAAMDRKFREAPSTPTFTCFACDEKDARQPTTGSHEVPGEGEPRRRCGLPAHRRAGYKLVRGK